VPLYCGSLEVLIAEDSGLLGCDTVSLEGYVVP